MKNVIVAVGFFLFSLLTAPPAFAVMGGEAQIDRIESWLQKLKGVMTMSRDTRAVAKELVDGDARNMTFHLQGLGRVYRLQDPRFEALLLEDIKELEDAIGEYDMWKSLDPSKAKKAEKEIVELLEKKGWSREGTSPHIDTISKFVREYNWLDYMSDRSVVLRTVQQHLQALASTRYDLTRLELEDGDGNGLHEFRRELRWFLIEVRGLNGLLNYNPAGTCEVAQYAPLLETNIVKHKYAILNSGRYETQPCYIEQCSILGLVRSVNVLGGIKDAAEEDQAAREADRVPAERVAEATTLNQEIQETRVFSRLSEQIGRCLQ